MPKYFRRLVLIIFILTFAVTAPILLLYSNGYRYDFKKHKLVRTGNLIIDSIPYGASIYLNGQLQKARLHFSIIPYKKTFGLRELGGTTPSVIDNIRPGEYLIEIKKQCYQEWKKILPIRAGQTTFSKKIFLFKKTPETNKIIDEDVTRIEISPDYEKVVFLVGSEVKILDLRNLEETLLLNSTLPVTDLFWSPSGKKVLLAASGDWQVLNLESGQKFSLSSLVGKGLEKVSWDKRESLYGVRYKRLIKIDLPPGTDNPSYKTVFNFPDRVSDWLIEFSKIFYIKLTDKTAFFETKNLRNSEKVLDSFELPYSANWQILKSFPEDNKRIFTLFNEEKKELLLLNLESDEEPILLKTKALGAKWREDQLLYYNDFELYQAWLEKRNEKIVLKKEVINRFSQELLDALWYPKGGYVIFSLLVPSEAEGADSVEIIELDGRDRRNVFCLAKGEIINDFVIGKKGKILWLTGTIKGESGLFKIKIQ